MTEFLEIEKFDRGSFFQSLKSTIKSEFSVRTENLILASNDILSSNLWKVAFFGNFSGLFLKYFITCGGFIKPWSIIPKILSLPSSLSEFEGSHELHYKTKECHLPGASKVWPMRQYLMNVFSCDIILENIHFHILLTYSHCLLSLPTLITVTPHLLRGLSRQRLRFKV